jgi:hypothetical protein
MTKKYKIFVFGYGMLSVALTGAAVYWFRPIDGITKKRLVPDEFKKHQETHHFHAPSCFCVILDEQEERMEAVFLVDPEHGWMIRCAKNKCGYAGRDACLIPNPSR